MKLFNFSKQLIEEENILIVEDLIIEMAVANFTDKSGQLTNIRSDLEARKAGWTKLGRAVYGNNGAIETGPMSMDHRDIFKKAGASDGLRFFWGIKGDTFVFTGKNQNDIEELYRKDRLKQLNGKLVNMVIGIIMKDAKVQPSENFKIQFRKTLENAGVLKN